VHNYVIDLGAPFFWVWLALVLLIVTPLSPTARRRAVIAASDLGFIALLTSLWGAFLAAGYALSLNYAANVAARRPARDRVRSLSLVLGAFTILVLFLMHKRAVAGRNFAALGTSARLLAAIGFSYVALRSVELLRAGYERTISSHWPDAISYLFPFHMLAAGPIQSWPEFWAKRGVTESPRDRLGVVLALDRIVQGLFKKFVLARIIEVTLLTGFTAPPLYQILEMQAYYLWVYLDFSAYSDIAVGVGRLLGVATPENFDRPLTARNLVVFWDRWHISLSSWVRRNVFIPLQLLLMRRSKGAHALLVASFVFGISFLLIGLWHEISLRFLLWGAMHAAGLIACNLWQRAIIARSGRAGLAGYLRTPSYRVIATVLTFEFVAFTLAFIVHPATRFLSATPR